MANMLIVFVEIFCKTGNIDAACVTNPHLEFAQGKLKKALEASRKF